MGVPGERNLVTELLENLRFAYDSTTGPAWRALAWTGCEVELERALDRNSGDLSSSKPLCLAQLCDLVQVTRGMVV